MNEYNIIYLNSKNEEKLIQLKDKIYQDDSIEILKYKISISLEEENLDKYYLFYKETYQTNIYEKLVDYFNKTTFKIRYEDLIIFIKNYDITIDESILEGKKDFTMEQVMELNLPEISSILKPLGLIFKHQNTSVIPYYHNTYNSISSITNNNNLLLEYNILNNNIYVCLYDEDIPINIYFPLLDTEVEYKKTDYSLAINSIDKHYELYNKTTHNLLNDLYYITDITFVLYPLQDITIPIESLFKVINSDDITPLILLNTKSDKMVRLYCPTKNKYGFKKPVLLEKEIYPFIEKNIKKNTISYYIKSKDLELLLEIDKNGNIYFKITNIKINNISKIENKISEYTNDIINKIKSIYDPTTKIFTSFTSLEQNNVKLKKINYYIYYETKKKLNPKLNKNYFNDILNYKIVNNEFQINFMRVSNFSVGDAITTYIYNLLKEDYTEITDIIEQIKDQFKLEDEEVSEKINRLFKNIGTENMKLNKKKNISNPGFKIIISEAADKYKINFQNIDNIKYIKIINIYLSNFLYSCIQKITPGILDDNYVHIKKNDIEEQDVGKTIIPKSEIDTIEESLSNKKMKKGNELEEESVIANSEDDSEDEKNDEANEETSENEMNEEIIYNEKEDKKSIEQGEESVIANSEDEQESVIANREDEQESVIANSEDEQESVIANREDEQESVIANSEDEQESVIANSEDEQESVIANSEDEQESVIANSEDEQESVIANSEDEQESVIANSEDEQESVIANSEDEQESVIANSEDEQEIISNAKNSKKGIETGEEERTSYNSDNSENSLEQKLKRIGGSVSTENSNNDKEFMEIDFKKKNPFLDNLQTKEPTIFYTGKIVNGKKYKGFSSDCDWQQKRIPIVATQKEKEKILRENPESVEGTWLDYGLNKDKIYHYYCPSYWNFKTNRPMSVGEAESDKNKKFIMGEKETRVTANKYIVKLFTSRYSKKIYPGFIDKSKNPYSNYMPCCFANKPNKENKQGKLILKVQEKLKKDEEDSSNSNNDDNTYILDNLKWPLDKNRLGHLPIKLLEFINHDSSKCLISQRKNKKISCLLRQGTYNYKKSKFSFLTAMSLIFNIDIETFINNIKDAIDLDTVMTLQNGSIPSHFYNGEILTKEELLKYKDTRLYKKLIKFNEQGLKRIISGMNNFKNKIENYKTETIDYTYLWDIICSGLIFKEPLNMIILEDDGMNITILCPSDDNSITSYDKNNKSIIIYKREDVYEPILSYNNPKDKNYFFNLNEGYPGVRQLLEKINYINQCKMNDVSSISENNESNIIKYRLALSLLETEKYIPPKYKIKTQVLNYNGMVCSIILEKIDGKKVKHIYIPVRPSSILRKYSYVTIDEIDDYLNNYEDTVNNSKKINEKSRNKLLLNIKFKLIHDGKIVGVITETNQYIKLKSPEENNKEDNTIIKPIYETNYYMYDKDISEHNKDEYIKSIANLRLEGKFFKSFADKIKVFLLDVNNFTIKRKIMNYINNKTLDPEHNIENKIKDILQKIVDDNFIFIPFNQDINNDLLVTVEGYDYKKSKTIDNINNYVPYTDKMCILNNSEGKCILPEINLYTNENNKEKYISVFIDNIRRNYKIYNKIFVDLVDYEYIQQFNTSDKEILLYTTNIKDYYRKLEGIIKLTDLYGFIENDTFPEIENTQTSESNEETEGDEPEENDEEGEESLEKQKEDVEESEESSEEESSQEDIEGSEESSEEESSQEDVEESEAESEKEDDEEESSEEESSEKDVEEIEESLEKQKEDDEEGKESSDEESETESEKESPEKQKEYDEEGDESSDEEESEEEFPENQKESEAESEEGSVVKKRNNEISEYEGSDMEDEYNDEENKNYRLAKNEYKKKIDNNFSKNNCIQMRFLETDSKWKDIFIGAKTFKFLSGECNIELLIIILKDFYFGLSKYKNNLMKQRKEIFKHKCNHNEENINIELIKSILIEAYEDLVNKKIDISKKFKDLNNNSKCLKKEIYKEDFIITETDIIVLCNYKKIPLVFCKSLRTNENNYLFFKTTNMTHDNYKKNNCVNSSVYHYFIRKINYGLKSKNENFLSLFYNKEDYIKINNHSLNDKYIDKILSINNTIEDYFNKPDNKSYTIL